MDESIDREALEHASNWIRDNIGNISDLPPELQNTIANHVYKYAKSLKEQEEVGVPTTLMGDSEDMFQRMRKYAKESAFLKSFLVYSPGLISKYRKLCKKNPEEKEFITFIFLCEWKYRIPNAMKKSWLRLKIESLFYGFSINEIPDLYKELSIVSDEKKSGTERCKVKNNQQSNPVNELKKAFEDELKRRGLTPIPIEIDADLNEEKIEATVTYKGLDHISTDQISTCGTWEVEEDPNTIVRNLLSDLNNKLEKE